MLSKQEKFEIICLVYDKWSKAVDYQKKIKDEKDDKSPDWALFHADRVEWAAKEVARYDVMLKSIKAEWPDAIPSI